MHDLDRTLQMLEPEGESGEYELSPEVFGHGAGASGELSPEAEMELAQELLAVTNEAELEQFIRRFPGLRRRGRYPLRRLFRRYPYRGRGSRGRYGLPYGGYGVQEPMPFVPPPLAPAAVVEADPDADDGPEELEFENARRLVRLGGALAKRLSGLPAAGEPETQELEAELENAPPAQTGRWRRRHGRIVLFGA
jgi:hypothetical protein